MNFYIKIFLFFISREIITHMDCFAQAHEDLLPL